MDLQMNLHLGLRALALLAFVAMCTAVLVKPGLAGAPSGVTEAAVASMLVIGHN
jgi:hypothetical protein